MIPAAPISSDVSHLEICEPELCGLPATMMLASTTPLESKLSKLEPSDELMATTARPSAVTTSPASWPLDTAECASPGRARTISCQRTFPSTSNLDRKGADACWKLPNASGPPVKLPTPATQTPPEGAAAMKVIEGE